MKLKDSRKLEDYEDVRFGIDITLTHLVVRVVIYMASRH